MQKSETENRNKISPQELVQELKDLLWGGDNFALFFPEDYKKKIEDNFRLFDRDQDDYLNMEEVRILLTSVDVDLPEEDVKTLYAELEEENKGVTINNFYLFIVKKKRDENKEAELLKCFRVIDKEATGFIKDADDFKDLMTGKGLRMMESDVVQMMEVMNPKGKDEFEYKEFCKIVGAKDEGKKKKKKKKGKKKK